ncbi:MAG: hypothetical protein KC502_08030 [Myxococcales bacterium]|nr:hypothetical protein [Myxococcales bacterium]
MSRLSSPISKWLLPVLIIAPTFAACGGGGGGIGAVNSMPSRATNKAMSKAEDCDDGDMKACNWVGIWFMVGGAGKDRKYEGKRYMRHACKNGYRPACKLARALGKRRTKSSSSTTRRRTSGQRAEAALPYSAPDNVRTVARRCDRGNLKSCHTIGAWLLLGKGDTPGKKRRVAGLKIIQKNCKAGYSKSCTLIQKLKEMIRKKKQRQGSI